MNPIFWEVMGKRMFTSRRWDLARSEVDGLIRLTGIETGSRVLDLCCGPGRHSLELARRGFKVTGVDQTRLFLEQARQRAGVERLAIEFIEGDVREFIMEGDFDLAINLYNSFGYFRDPGDNRRVLANAYRSLRSGGRLVVEMASKEIIIRTFQELESHDESGVSYHVERSHTDDWSWIAQTWLIERGAEKRELRYARWLYSGQELAALLESVGFKSVSLYGGFGGEAYDTTAGTLVVVARK